MTSEEYAHVQISSQGHPSGREAVVTMGNVRAAMQEAMQTNAPQEAPLPDNVRIKEFVTAWSMTTKMTRNKRLVWPRGNYEIVNIEGFQTFLMTNGSQIGYTARSSMNALSRFMDCIEVDGDVRKSDLGVLVKMFNLGTFG